MHSCAMGVDPLRFEDGRRLLIAGLTERYRPEDSAVGIPGQWQRFSRYFGRIAGQVGQVAYGISSGTDEAGSMDYLCGFEVADFSSMPRNFGRLCIAAQRYAVFSHRDHIASIRYTWDSIWNAWLPGSGHEAADALCFERYGESFDPRTGSGGVELWVPIAQASMHRGEPVHATRAGIRRAAEA